MAADPSELSYRRLNGNKAKKIRKGKWRFMMNDGDIEETDYDLNPRVILVRDVNQISPS
jgi:hypothetical protein